MRKIKYILLIVFVLILSMIIHTIKRDNALSSAKEWATDNGYLIKETDTHITTFGSPFYYLNKGQIIIELGLVDRTGGYHKVWMREGVFTNDFIEE